MITKEQQRTLGFKTRRTHNILWKVVKREWIASKHSVLKLDNDCVLLIRGQTLFLVQSYSHLLDLWNCGYKDLFFEKLWKMFKVDIGKMKFSKMKEIVEAAKLSKTVDSSSVEASEHGPQE